MGTRSLMFNCCICGRDIADNIQYKGLTKAERRKTADDLHDLHADIARRFLELEVIE